MNTKHYITLKAALRDGNTQAQIDAGEVRIGRPEAPAGMRVVATLNGGYKILPAEDGRPVIIPAKAPQAKAPQAKPAVRRAVAPAHGKPCQLSFQF